MTTYLYRLQYNTISKEKTRPLRRKIIEYEQHLVNHLNITVLDSTVLLSLMVAESYFQFYNSGVRSL